MHRKKIFFCLMTVLFVRVTLAQELTGPYGEKFKSKIIAKDLSDPWEITYGPDNHLWVTEAKGYRVSRINPESGEKKVLLDLNDQRQFPRYDRLPDSIDSGKPWPQGGLMGMALHPQLLNGRPYVYLAYIYQFAGAGREGRGEEPEHQGFRFKARIVCYEYDPQAGTLSKPAIICDTIPASSDHNGGRLLIAPVDGVDYLFYSTGDLGSGQYANGGRTNYAQNTAKYEGKILRFNTVPDSDLDIYDRWIPNDNPFNTSRQNAVWSYGHRNPEGLAYVRINNRDYLYSSEHGPFSDDEVNIIEKGKNYGHPLIIGYNDNNYNGFAAAVSDNKELPGTWHTTYPLIVSENQNADSIGRDYRDPIKSFYPADGSALKTLFDAIKDNTDGKTDWQAVAPSGIEVYTSSAIPGWQNSLLIPSLKEGRLLRLKLNKAGDGINGDTINYFKAGARYRDIALSPDGKKIWVATDSSSVTSGPSGEDPEANSIRGSIIEFTWQSGGTDLDELEAQAATVEDQKSAKLLLKQLVSSIKSMDGGTTRKVLFSPEMKLAFNLLIKRRLTAEDIQLTKKLTSGLVSTLRQSNSGDVPLPAEQK